jgi:lipopolysaccharide transport system ATP-binding protein
MSVGKGEVVGIIGRNGAGKSTLLKILSRITSPTTGQFKVKGRIASLLEVGTGFHPDLTGRENIFLNGAILGMTKKEITTKFDEIVSFSGVERYIDTPVKRYSSGMYVRLAFAVAAHLEPEILIIDEVLAVGDAEFQKKCLGKMKDVAGEGRTILFVSHNMAAVKSLCTSAILLESGEIVANGNVDSVLEKYLASSEANETTREVSWNGNNAPGNEEFRLLGIKTKNEKGEIQNTFYSSNDIVLEFNYKLTTQLIGLRIVLQVKDHFETLAFASTNQLTDTDVKQAGTYISTCVIPGNLLNRGKYTIMVSADIANQRNLVKPFTALSLDVILMGNNGSFQENWPGIVAPLLEWKTTKQ